LIFLITFGEEYKLWNSSLCNFLQRPIISFLFRTNILLSTLYTNTLNLCSSFNVRDKFLHLFKTTGKIIVFFHFD
jgi:hypothetical protein